MKSIIYAVKEVEANTVDFYSAPRDYVVSNASGTIVILSLICISLLSITLYSLYKRKTKNYK